MLLQLFMCPSIVIFNGILSMQIAAISCLKYVKVY